MTVFNDRRTATHTELSGDRDIAGQLHDLNKIGLSGGQLPSRPDTTKYPLDQTASVVNMR